MPSGLGHHGARTESRLEKGRPRRLLSLWQDLRAGVSRARVIGESAMSEPKRPATRRHTPDVGADSSRNMLWVIVWVGLGLVLGLMVAATQGRGAATEYFAAYLLEESLSVDNIF